MTARLSGWYAWRRIGSETVECVQYAEATWFAARAEASRACGVEAMGLVCEKVPEPRPDILVLMDSNGEEFTVTLGPQNYPYPADDLIAEAEKLGMYG